MKILITGAKGFIGSNLIAELRNCGEHEIFAVDVDTSMDTLDRYLRNCDFVFHLAGVNRPEQAEDFWTGNFGFTKTLLDKLKASGNRAPILTTSSIQANLDTPYGKSKKAGEDILRQYGKQSETNIYIFRFPNVFGKWCKPNYNSVVATFCYNIAHNLPIQINDPETVLELVYIDDIVQAMLAYLKSPKPADGFEKIKITYSKRLREISRSLYEFKESRKNLQIPEMSDLFTKKLYSTYLSYLPEHEFSYPLNMKIDHRGSFTEFIHTKHHGQVSVNVFQPGVTKGKHWHHTKVEKFLVVAGKAMVKFRKINESKVITYSVSGEKLEVIDVPVGYTHEITNIGECNMVAIIWSNEEFDPNHADTYMLEV